MRKLKFIALITSILSALSLLSTGFSSWYYLNPQTVEYAGSIQAYAVEDMSISITGMTVFSFSALEFKDGSEDDTGEITVNYSVPKGAIEASSGNFTVNFELTYSDLSDYAEGDNILFNNLTVNSSTTAPDNSVTVKCGSDVISDAAIVVENESEKIIFSKAFENVSASEPYTFTVTYIFKISSDGGNFRNTFGKYINQKSTNGDQYTKFVAKATIDPT